MKGGTHPLSGITLSPDKVSRALPKQLENVTGLILPILTVKRENGDALIYNEP